MGVGHQGGSSSSIGTSVGKWGQTLKSQVKEEADQDRKSVENVARTKNIAKNKIHARQESIQKKIIDEARVKAAIIKDVVKDKKKKQKESGSNPMIDFEPKLKKPGIENTF